MEADARGKMKIAQYSKGQWIFILALFLCIPILGWLISADVTNQLDRTISQWAALRNDDATGPWAQFLLMITWLGDFEPRMAIAVIVAACLYRGRGALSAVAFVAFALMSSGFTSVMKIAFDRPRPDIIAHLDHVGSASFPSGHASGAAVLYVMIAFALPARFRALGAAVAVVMIGLMGLSRISLGVHWFTDVVAGVASGLAFAVLARPYIMGRT